VTFPLVAIIGCALAVYLVLLSNRLAQPNLRTGLEAPVAALLVLALGAAYLLATGEGTALALISALLVSASAVFGLLFNASVQRQKEERLRWERRADMQRALRTEIEAIVGGIVDVDWPRLRARVETQFDEDPKFIPFVPLRTRDRYLKTVLPRIEILEEDQIAPIMRYYIQLEEVQSLTRDIRSRAYSRLKEERRLAMFISLLEMEEVLLEYGQKAVSALGGRRVRPSRPKAVVSDAVSNTDRGPSDPDGAA